MLTDHNDWFNVRLNSSFGRRNSKLGETFDKKLNFF